MSDSIALQSDVAERVAAVLARYRAPVLDGMRAALDRPDLQHVRLMRYHLGWEDAEGTAVDAPAGKMLRPALCLLSCEAAGGSLEHALPAAVAIELLHNFTLVHDDIEDASDTRHGRPALWRVAGVAQAINAGDGMFAVAHRALLRLSETDAPPERVLHAARVLDDACIALCEGQHADISFEGRAAVTQAEYEAMIAGKTSALLGASAAIGAICGGAAPARVDAFARCGYLLGLAFQAQDDVLGIWGDAAATGKPVADDIRARKKSFPVVHAFDHLDTERRTELERLYAAPSLDNGAVTRVLALLDAAGSREAVTSAAQRWSDEALRTLAPLELAKEPARDIAALAQFFVRRSN